MRGRSVGRARCRSQTGVQSSAVKVASLAYRTDLAILGLGGSRLDEYDDHIVVTSPHLPTYWWANFLLLRDLPDERSSPGWLERFGTTFPSATHVALGIDAVEGSVADLAWFTERGFVAEAPAVMTADQLNPPTRVNRDAVYRELRSDADWAASLALRGRCSTDAPRAAPPAAELDISRAAVNRQVVQAGHGGWFGAFIGGRLVAQLGLVATGDGNARYQSVETDPGHRRRGLAGSLLYHAAKHGLDELGARRLVIVADPAYHAIALYRSLGFQVQETQLMMEHGPVSP
jgi:ribosomal protein S18 acetylase RimI-like enzyme